MADDTNTTSSQGRPEGGGRGQRRGGDRDAGGFRIRLSDNEMQAARALQEAFNLRSTVAVLGFSLRTLAQLLEEGKLDEVIAQQRAQGQSRPSGPRQERGERRGDRDRGPDARGGRVDPFARPSRPAAAAATEQPAGGDESNVPAAVVHGADDSADESLSDAATAPDGEDANSPGSEAVAESAAES